MIEEGLRGKLLSEVYRGIEGKNGTIPFPVAKLDEYLDIAKNTNYLLVGDTGGGKSTLAQDLILNILDWYFVNKSDDIKLSIIYLGMERKQYMYTAKWVSRRIFIEEGIYISSKKILGRQRKRDANSGRLTSEYDILTKEELEKVEFYSKIFDLWEQDEVFKVIEGTHNVTGIKKFLDDFAKRHGERKPREEGPLSKEIYVPHHPNHIVLIVTDYIGVLDVEKDTESGQKKLNLDKYSAIMRRARDLYGFSPINIQQLSRAISDINRLKLNDLKPKISDIAETSTIGRDADVILAIFDSYTYLQEGVDRDTIGYDLSKMKDERGVRYYRSLHILKNSFETNGISMGAAFMPQTGIIKSMPKLPANMTSEDYESLRNWSYFLQ